MLYVTLEPGSHTSMLIGLALQFWGKKILFLDKRFFSTLKILSSVPQHYCCWVWGKSFFLALLLSLFVCCPMLFQDLASIYFTTLPSDVTVLSFHWFVGKLSGNLSSGDVPVNSEGACGYSTFRGASCQIYFIYAYIFCYTYCYAVQNCYNLEKKHTQWHLYTREV